MLPYSGALQGVLPKVPPAASFPQGPEVDWEILYFILDAGGRDKLAPWTLWQFMPQSKRALPTFLYFKSHSNRYSHRWTATMKTTRSAAEMNTTQLPTLASATQNLATVTKKETKSLPSSIGLVSMRSVSAGAAALKLPSMTCN